MGDVLFDAGKSDLRPQAREALAKLCGVVLNDPSLRLTIEGHTDNTGSAEINQTVSERRANAVSNYLVQQGLNSSSLSAQGLGTSNPVADNGTAEGRQKNRRVEIIVSGEVIGTQMDTKTYRAQICSADQTLAVGLDRSCILYLLLSTWWPGVAAFLISTICTL